MPVEAARRCPTALAGSTTVYCATAIWAVAAPRRWPFTCCWSRAADAQGLSYYSDARIAEVLALAPQALSEARRQLIALGLIAYQKPLYQLLSLQDELTAESRPRPPRAELDPEPSLPASSPRGLPLKATVERLLQQTGGSAP
jgi:hypothetical protein